MVWVPERAMPFLGNWLEQYAYYISTISSVFELLTNFVSGNSTQGWSPGEMRDLR